MIKNLLFLFIILVTLPLASRSQETGAFQNSITINEPGYNVTRTVYYYVPTDYNAANSYKLIVGFRGGPHTNAGQFRNQLTPLSDSLNAIIICPENISDFNNNEGNVKFLFSHSVAAAVEEYSIDTNFIYITGLSFGGRHTIIVGMDSDSGPISNNIRGIIPFAPGTNSQNVADYENSTRFPICTCIGANDNGFMSVATTFTDNVIENGGTAMLNVIPGIGHTTNFPEFSAEMMECFHFIENAYQTTGIRELEKKTIKLFPNPSSGDFTLEMEEPGLYTVEIIDLVGKNVFKKEYNTSQSIRVQASGLKSGIYIVSVLNNNKTINSLKLYIK
jgi:hypothetical protein